MASLRKTDRRRPWRAAAACVLLLAAAAAARQGPAATSRPRGLFELAAQIPEAVPGRRVEPEAFEFARAGYRYRVAANGAGRRMKAGGADDGPPRLFNLRLAGADRITRVYHAEYEGNVLLACEVSDGETGAGLVVRLEQPSMRALWRAELPAFNLGPPLRDGGHLYLTGIGFAAKLDLGDGRFAWRQSRLYGRAGEGTFNSFGPPEIERDAVVFREASVEGRPPKSVRVHRKTGKILGIE